MSSHYTPRPVTRELIAREIEAARESIRPKYENLKPEVRGGQQMLDGLEWAARIARYGLRNQGTP